MILRCCRPPRSGGRNAVRPTLTVIPTARFSWSAWSAIDAAARTAASTVDSSPRPVWIAALEVEDDPRVGGLLEVELLDLDLAVAGGRLPVDPVHRVAGRVRPDGRRHAASSGGSAPGEAWLPSRRPPAGASAAAARAAGRPRPRSPARPSPTPRRSRTGRRSGCAAARSGNGRGATSGARMSHDRSVRPPQRDRPARQPAGQRRRVVDLEPQLRDPAGVAQRVGHAHPVADMAVQLADRVARLEIGQAEPDQDVRAADDQDREVEQVEQERQRRREGRDDEDDGDDEQLELADHRSAPTASVAWSIRLGARRRRRSRGRRCAARSGRRRSGGCRRSRSTRAARGRPGRPGRRGSRSWS